MIEWEIESVLKLNFRVLRAAAGVEVPPESGKLAQRVCLKSTRRYVITGFRSFHTVFNLTQV